MSENNSHIDSISTRQPLSFKMENKALFLAYSGAWEGYVEVVGHMTEKRSDWLFASIKILMQSEEVISGSHTVSLKET